MKKNSSTKQKKQQTDPAVKALQKQVQALINMQQQQAPAAVGKTLKRRPPKVHSEGDCVVITHSELFDWPTGSAIFTVNLFGSINPGLQSIFPWLGGVAENFEEYRFRKLRFSYEPRVATTQAGQLIMAIDPKSGDFAPESLQVVSTYSMRSNSSMWKPTHIDAEPEILAKRRFVRTTDISNNDIRSLYDVGRLVICSDGASPAGAVIGEVEVSYTVELWIPASPPSSNIPSCWGNGVPATASSSNLFGNLPTTGGMLMDFIAGNAVQLKNCVPSGNNQPTAYSVWLYITGTGLTASGISYNGGTAINSLVNPLGAGTSLMAYHTWRPTLANPILNLTATATTVTDCLLVVSRCPDTLPF